MIALEPEEGVTPSIVAEPRIMPHVRGQIIEAAAGDWVNTPLGCVFVRQAGVVDVDALISWLNLRHYFAPGRVVIAPPECGTALLEVPS